MKIWAGMTCMGVGVTINKGPAGISREPGELLLLFGVYSRLKYYGNFTLLLLAGQWPYLNCTRMSFPCSVCKKNVAKDWVKCKVCITNVAHPSCAGKSKAPWTCSGCRAESDSTKAGGSNPPSNPASEAGDLLGEQLANLAATMHARFDAIEEGMKTTRVDLEAAINFLSAKFDDLLKTMAEQNKTIIELRKGMDRVNAKVNEKDVVINQLTARKKIGAPQLSSENVVDVYRMPGRTPRAGGERPRTDPPIVVKFKAASVRSAWLEGRRRLQQPRQDVNAVPGPSTAAAAAATPATRNEPRGAPPVRIYEALTPYLKRLLYLTRGAATAKGYKFVWVRDGKIFAHRSSNIMKCCTLYVSQMTQRSTSADICRSLNTALVEFGVDVDQVISTCTDRGANVLKACKDLFGENKVTSCVCHLADNVVQDSLYSLPIVNALLKDVKQLSPTTAILGNGGKKTQYNTQL
ncbi:Hypothetical predicted protein [Cloeon dipterum]|uniref:FP protein C-terminal domain-containing protein n=1 Tax=Cloeon dipterum TaxID=197152 RepID=A0A8S1DYH2_9INSE|nr:Hypothetical predicted protein [Cloeon dipterum]